MARPAGLIVGPAKYVLNSVPFYSDGDVTVNIEETTIPHMVRGMEIDRNLVDATVSLSVKPDGQLTSGVIAKMWPYMTSQPGEGLGLTPDKSLVIHDSNSHLYTIHNAFVTSQPSLHLGIEDTILGAVGITGVRKSSALAWEVGSLYTCAATGGTFADTTWTAPVRQEYSAAWTGSDGKALTAFHSKGGFRIKVDTQVNLHSGPVLGTFMGTFIGMSVTVECEPAEQTGIELMTVLASQHASNKRGVSVSSLGGSLVITGESNTAYIFTLPKAIVVGGAYNFGSSSGFLRNGVFGFVASRTFASGVPVAPFTMAIA